MSKIFLFDRERTGRQIYTLPEGNNLKVTWEKKLPQFPNSGPESTPVIDKEGNIYFGCHNGCIYSLNNNGKIRWQFQTANKVYSSPLLLDNNLYFCCNNLDVICLSLTGELIWVFEGYRELMKTNRISRIFSFLTSYLIYDYHAKSLNTKRITAWCSPNYLENNNIIVNLYGLGIVSLEYKTGKLIWKRKTSKHFHQALSSVAITTHKDQEVIIALSQTNKLMAINKKGEKIWERPLKRFFNSWATPAIDPEKKEIYCSTSIGNKKSIIYKFDLEGNLLWKKHLNTGIRGSATIPKEDFIVIPCLNGELKKISKITGKILQEWKIGSKHLGLWTNSSIDESGNIIINSKLSFNTGRLNLIQLNKQTSPVTITYGKALGIPLITEKSKILTATWESKVLEIEIDN
ncbi:MAG: PQQ-like beta-propeller repeat protein [Lunatimonas sp.]|uniref:outer membrane protein assembly factor BamB family protein n=1 Tax=Lunatimonas sp. TaxID=2060141 RepID=UPI00263AE954|nr:PQQ-binding-like beta-propeller repeat protein [Lunatimonas sp.]MCC5936792.1 PQQ-like beta-propeller repeat protein [Lunatimonas sp.]